MNHPFQAFGALVGLAAAAMLAVSSTSRSTIVRAPHQPPAATAATQPPVRPCGSMYVVVLPAAGGEAEAEHEAADVPSGCEAENGLYDCATGPCYATGCGLDRSTGIVYGCEPCFVDCSAYDDVCSRYSRLCPMSPARVELARNNAARLVRDSTVDCRSYYDPTYDQIVYGAESARRSASGRPTMPPVRSSDAQWDELIGLFQGITGPLDDRSQPRATTRRIAPAAGPAEAILHDWSRSMSEAFLWLDRDAWRRSAENLRSMALGVRNYAVNSLQRGWAVVGIGANERRFSATGAAVPWNDYTELLDRRDSAAASRQPHANPATSAVRSSGWLLHSAASMLNHAGIWLQQTAEELDRAGANLEARQGHSRPR